MQINAAMVGNLIFEADRLNDVGKVCQYSHTWLHMIGKDLNAFQALHGYMHARAGINTFMNDIEARDMVCAIDVSQFRAKYFSVCIPPGCTQQVFLFSQNHRLAQRQNYE